MDAFLLIASAVGLGALVRQAGALSPDHARPLDVWVLWVALPALVLELVPTLRPEPALALAIAGPWVAAVAALVMIPPLARRLGADRQATGALVLTAMLGNTAFVGLAAVQALRGDEAMAVALVSDQLGSFLALSTLGLGTAAAYAGDRASAGEITWRMVKFPPFIALVVAGLIGVAGTSLPEAAHTLLRRLGDTLVPVALFTVGLRLQVGAVRRRAGLLVLGLTQRLVVGPALVLGLAVAVGVDGIMRDAAVLQSGMAPMVTAGILAADHDLDAELAALMVGVGLVASAGSMLLWSTVLAAP